MRNNIKSKIRTIFSAAKNLPYFSFDDLAGLETNKTYLKILFSRYNKSGKVVRLKKGLYVAKDYLEVAEKTGRISAYLEFLSGVLYSPSYLSLDYVLYQHNILTEVPKNFTSMTMKKTADFSNKFGNYFYHKITKRLFCGFEIFEEDDFTILKARKSKALFDFLYLRKNLLVNKKAVQELRLNLSNLNKHDFKELNNYIKLEDSEKMRRIFNYLL